MDEVILNLLLCAERPLSLDEICETVYIVLRCDVSLLIR